MLTFANPLGFLALLGIPVIIFIHLLQRKASIVPISTLFLLEKTQRDQATGRKLDRINPSIPFWMQILSVLLLSWLLSEPKFPLTRSTQRIAIVVDSSASMRVFKDSLIKKISTELPLLKGFATEVEFTLLESIAEKTPIYKGVDLNEMFKKINTWQPTSGLTDPTQSLRLARSLVSREGIVIYATDTPIISAPYNAHVLSVGKNIDNVGFTGVALEEKDNELIWKATLQNYSTNNLKRTWQLTADDGTKTKEQYIEINPKSLITLQASFPKNAKRITVKLSADEFSNDDELPLIRPLPKKLTMVSSINTSLAKLSEKMLRSIEALNTTANVATNHDLSLIGYDPLDPIAIKGNAIIFVEDNTQGGKYLSGGIIAEFHSLINDLNFQSLLIRETIELDILPTDQILLRQGKRPLILLRTISAMNGEPSSQQLLFNFDLKLSNLQTQSAFIVILHRFIEILRNNKIALSQENLETSQLIKLAARDKNNLFIQTIDQQGNSLSKKKIDPCLPITTPDNHGFFRISEGEETLLDASVFFADTREADFSLCAEINELNEAKANAINAHSKNDPWWQYWVLALMTAVIASWYFVKNRAITTSHAPN
jgi:Aerotolerance regulator N-terminal